MANDFLPRPFIQTNSRLSSIKPSRANLDFRGRCDAPVHSRNAPRPRKNCLTVRSVWGTTDVFVTVGRFDHLSLPPLSVRIGQLRRPIPSCRRSWAELAVAARLPAEIPEWRLAELTPHHRRFFGIVSEHLRSHACPYRKSNPDVLIVQSAVLSEKSYPDVLMMQSGQDRNGDNDARPLD